MWHRLIKTLTLTILIATSSCILPYELEVQKHNKVIVVNGVVTTEHIQHIIKLGYTYPIDAQEKFALTDAQVWIEDDLGNIYDFSEDNAGDYKSRIPFAASPERVYQLKFTNSNGNQYYSSKIKPIISPPISSINNRYGEIIPKNTSSKVGGIQFFLNSYDSTNRAKHFRYVWQDTYQIVTPYTSNFDYDTISDEIIQREIPISICYVSDSSSSLIIGSTTGSTQNRIADLPIRFVSGETDALRNRYSILVKQYAIDNETYTYYRKLKDSDRSGSLFDEQQGTILGNISSDDNPDEVVLGNFEVSGVSSKRVFFNFADLDHELRYPSYRFICSDYDLVGTSLDSVGFIFERPSNSLNIISANEFSEPQVALGPGRCTDCSWFASNIKPDFWID